MIFPKVKYMHSIYESESPLCFSVFEKLTVKMTVYAPAPLPRQLHYPARPQGLKENAGALPIR
jgi:hypothetical protein